MHRSPHLADAHAAASPVGAARHAAPQAPQLATDVARSTSQPLVGLPSQSPNPAAQTMPHTPAVQVAALACGRIGHDVPQQFAGVIELQASMGGASTVTTSGCCTSTTSMGTEGTSGTSGVSTVTTSGAEASSTSTALSAAPASGHTQALTRPSASQS